MLKIIVQKSISFSDQQIAKLEEAKTLLEVAINSERFKEEVLKFSHGGGSYSTGWGPWRRWHQSPLRKYFSWNFYTTLDGKDSDTLTNEEVYAFIMRGKSLYEATGNSAIEIQITMSNQRGVLGWTYPNQLMTWVSAWFFNSSDSPDIASNLAHEAMHKLGFDHTFNWTHTRDFTIPYAVGNIVYKICRELIKK